MAAVEARIAEGLLPLTRAKRVGHALLPPPAYVRRYAVEHAAAGGVLDHRLLSSSFLPFVDPARLRPLLGAADAGPDARLVWVWRHAAHAWR